MNMLYLNDSVALSVIEQTAMVGSPRWMLDGRKVFIGPYHSADERESHLGVTVGSMEWLWSDTEEFRFDQQSLALVSAFLVLSDATLDTPELLDPWFLAPVQVGVPKLVETMKNFQVDTTPARWIDPQCQALTSVLPSAFDEKIRQRLRLRIAPDLELFFADEYYCGWSLSNPVRYIVDEWEGSSQEEVNEALVALVYDYMLLVTNPSLDLMSEQDPETKQRLMHLHERARMLQSTASRAAIVRDAVADKLDRFYDFLAPHQENKGFP